jgi:hypothetical protein
VNALLNFTDSQNSGNFLTNGVPVSFSRIVLLHAVGNKFDASDYYVRSEHKYGVSDFG